MALVDYGSELDNSGTQRATHCCMLCMRVPLKIVATSADTDSAESSNSEDSYFVQSDNDRQGNCSTKA